MPRLGTERSATPSSPSQCPAGVRSDVPGTGNAGVRRGVEDGSSSRPRPCGRWPLGWCLRVAARRPSRRRQPAAPTLLSTLLRWRAPRHHRSASAKPGLQHADLLPEAVGLAQRDKLLDDRLGARAGQRFKAASANWASARAAARRRPARASGGRPDRTSPARGPGRVAAVRAVRDRHYGEFRGHPPGQQEVLPLEGPLELRVGTAPRGHEHMFA
jgi:hypothetical protein